jgi:hypothetical protein
MGILKKQNKKQIEQELVDTLRKIQRKKYLEIKEQISQRDKLKHFLFKEIKKEINKEINTSFSKLTNRLKRGVERYILIELNSIKDLNTIKYADIKKIVKKCVYLIRKTKFYEIYKTKKISKSDVRKEIYEKARSFLSVDSLSTFQKRKIGEKINEWLKENNGTGALTLNEFDVLERFVLNSIEELYKDKSNLYGTNKIINSFLNQPNYQKILSRRTTAKISEIKKEFRAYLEDNKISSELTKEDKRKLDRVLFKIIIRY